MKQVFTDDELVAGCRQQNRRMQELLYKRYASKLMGICRRYAASREEAEDVLQDAFVRIFCKIDSYDTTRSLEAWLKRIVVNSTITIYRFNSARIQTMGLDDNESVYNTYSHTPCDTDHLLSAISMLPDNYRIVFNMHIVEGYSHKEIAEIAGITEMQSRVQLNRARKHLRKILSPAPALKTDENTLLMTA